MPLKLFSLVACMICAAVGFGQPVANFNSTLVSGCVPLTVNFQDQSTGNPTAWQWNLGNSTLSNQQSPATTYFNAGTYTVSLKVSNAAGSDSITKTQYITVYDRPVVNFAAAKTTGCFPLSINFIDLSSSASSSIMNWDWDFGDGDTSALQNPQYTYTAAGNYSVTLTATDNNGCSKVFSQAQYIKIPNGVIAGFANSLSAHCKPPDVINFTGLSTGPATLSYQWDFGDGNTSSITSPSNNYTTGGNYSVQLIVKSSDGCVDTITKQNSIVINDFQTTFSGPDTICTNASGSFNKTSAPAGISSLWSFGDSTTATVNSTTKIWSAPATYMVKLVNNYGACLDSVIKPVVVLAPSVVNFTSNDSANCKAPLSIQFQDLTAGSSSWSWSFGDGNTSNLQNPSHIYSANGNFSVTLTVSNGAGCTSTITKSQYIKIGNPTVQFTPSPAGGCIPYTFKPVAAINDAKGIATYLWDFGDGNTSVAQNPSNIYTLAGTYKVKLYVTTNDGCNDSAIVPAGVKTGTPATVNFSALPLTQCVGQNIAFTDMSVPADTWAWNFGDGTTSVLQNPSHAYKINGAFSITLAVLNNGCSANLTKPALVQALPPVAKFTPVINCSNKTQVTFADNSVLPITWAWDFGDGNTSTAQNPAYIYSALGNYTVTLTVTNAGCSNTITTAIKLVNEHADFTTLKDSICKNIGVLFTAINSNAANIKNYTWYFGDGTTFSAVSATATHAYTIAGTYPVKLIITDINGCKDSINKPAYITIVGPTAGFSGSSLAGCNGLNVLFSDNSVTDGSHPIKNWQWNYGDGTVQSLNNSPFSHTYISAGSFTVKLKITDSNGCSDSLNSAAPILITIPKAGFTSADTLACINKNVSFINTSTGNNLAYAWAFGNGLFSSQQNPVTAYNSDSVYSVKLVVTDINGCKDSLQSINYINLTAAAKASFSVSDSVSSCAPFKVEFTNNSLNSIGQAWDFGDGSSSTIKNLTHYYSVPGTYTASLFSIGQQGCADTAKKVIHLFSSDAVLTYTPLTGCSPASVKLHLSTAGPVSYFWDFGDGNTTATSDSDIINNYQLPGSYIPKILLTDPTGCQVPVTGSDTIQLTKSYVNFGTPDSVACTGSAIAFIDSTTGNATITAWHWDFGDGTTSSLHNPMHLYTASGTYAVKLVVQTMQGCTDSLIKNNYIHIFGPVAKFNTSTLAGCKQLNVIFLDNSTTDGAHAIINWQWNFGDGNVQSFTGGPFSHAYDTGGYFIPQLKITDAFGCSDSFILSTPILVAQPKAGFNSTDTLACSGSNVSFSNTSSGINLVYAWALGNGVTSTQANPVTVYTTDNSYTVKLIVTDSLSCKDSFQLINYIKTKTVKASFSITDSISSCPPLTVIFTNTSINDTSLAWNFGDGNFSVALNPSHIYTLPGTYIATLIATGPGGCIDSFKRTIQLLSPSAIVSYSPLHGCSQMAVNFHITTSAQADFFWDFNDGDTITTTTPDILHTYIKPGSYLPQVTVNGVGGCHVPITVSDTIHLTKTYVNFTAPDSTVCFGSNVSFTNTTTANAAIALQQWQFGDGITSNLQSPLHLYNTPGNYTVELIVNTIDGCSDSFTKNNFITVHSVPTIGFTGDTSSCTPALLTFAGILLQPDTSTINWQWYFGNGATSAVQDPAAQLYSTPGDFQLQLVAQTISGCSDTLNKTIHIRPLPVTNAGSYATGCSNAPVQLQATGADTYTWSPADYLSCINCAAPVSTPADTVTYYVEGTSAYNCKSTDTVFINVHKKFVLTVTHISDSICLGRSVQLNASGAANYIWLPATGLNNSNAMNPVAQPDSDIIYQVIGTDNFNCFKDSATVAIRVFPYPTVIAGADKNIAKGETVMLAPQYSTDVSTWLWSPPDGLNCTDCANPTAAPVTSTAYAITVTNKAGCSATDSVSIFLPCEGSIFIPTAFTPNNDGLNDVFYPMGKDVYSILSMTVYDRWGKTIFHKLNFAPNDASQGWDGTYQGQQAGPATYVYIMQIKCKDGTISNFKGAVTLIR